jgi:hypothetical protein
VHAAEVRNVTEVMMGEAENDSPAATLSITGGTRGIVKMVATLHNPTQDMGWQTMLQIRMCGAPTSQKQF